MPDLSRTWRWARYEPTLADNRETEHPFFLRVKSGISKAEIDAYKERWASMRTATEPTASMLLEALGGLVELGDEPLSVCGNPIDSMEKYADLVLGLPTAEPLVELTWAVLHFNSLPGTTQLFYERLSGSEAFTNSQRAATPNGRAKSGASTRR